MGARMQENTSTTSHFQTPSWIASSEESGDDTSPRPRLLPSPAPIICQPWCEASNGHPNQRLREDQCCYGRQRRVPLSSEPVERIGNGSTEQQYLNTYLMRLADDLEPHVFIGYNEAPGRAATAGEARRFALAILALVDDLEA